MFFLVVVANMHVCVLLLQNLRFSEALFRKTQRGRKPVQSLPVTLLLSLPLMLTLPPKKKKNQTQTFIKNPLRRLKVRQRRKSQLQCGDQARHLEMRGGEGKLGGMGENGGYV